MCHSTVPEDAQTLCINTQALLNPVGYQSELHLECLLRSPQHHCYTAAVDQIAPRKFAAPLRLLGTIAWAVFLLVGPLGIPASTAYWATALLSCFIFYLAYRPGFFDILAILGSALALAGFRMFVVLHRLVLPDLGLSFALLGLGAWFVVGLRFLWAKHGEDRSRLLSRVVTPSAVLLILLFASNNLINFMGLLHIKTVDLYAFSFDGSLGFQSSFVIGGWMQRYPWFGWPVVVLYLSILLPITLAYVVDMEKGINRPFYMLELFFSASFLGYLFYNLFPAAGPVYVFPSFPTAPLTFAQTSHLAVESIPLSPNVMRNALPSLHMAWALLIWWNMKKLSRVACWIAFVYVLFTVCGTLGTGEHYVVDLVVSFPFALMIQALSETAVPLHSPLRSGAILGGLAGVLVWIAMLRYANPIFWISPIVPWMLISITIAMSLVVLFRLLAAANRPNPVSPDPRLSTTQSESHRLVEQLPHPASAR